MNEVLYFDSNFTKICSQGSDWQWVSIGSGNGLALNRRQAITWTNANPFHRRIYAALGGDRVNGYHQGWSQAAVRFLATSAISWKAAIPPQLCIRRHNCPIDYCLVSYKGIPSDPTHKPHIMCDIPSGNDMTSKYSSMANWGRSVRTWEIQGAHLISHILRVRSRILVDPFL